MQVSREHGGYRWRKCFILMPCALDANPKIDQFPARLAGTA
jgi:hypothetical protein